MVRGVGKFREFFKDYSDKYVLIGGAACDLWFSEAGGEFRATNDFDIILIVEALNKDFFSRFWEFIKAGRYGERQHEENARKYYRFNYPGDDSFPKQIELFSRVPDGIELPEDLHLTPIPAGEDISSLSAIILDDVFYGFVKNNTEESDGISLINIPGLICLKAKAFFELNQRKSSGGNIDDREIRKHKKDVIRLLTIVSREKKTRLPDKIKDILRNFIEDVRTNPVQDPNIIKEFKSFSVREKEISDFIDTSLREIFEL